MFVLFNWFSLLLLNTSFHLIVVILIPAARHILKRKPDIKTPTNTRCRALVETLDCRNMTVLYSLNLQALCIVITVVIGVGNGAQPEHFVSSGHTRVSCSPGGGLLDAAHPSLPVFFR